MSSLGSLHEPNPKPGTLPESRTRSDRWRGQYSHREHGSMSVVYCPACGKPNGLGKEAEGVRYTAFCDDCYFQFDAPRRSVFCGRCGVKLGECGELEAKDKIFFCQSCHETLGPVPTGGDIQATQVPVSFVERRD